MVLITPHRPVVTPIPQITPHQVSATVGAVQVTAIDTTVVAESEESGTTVLEGDFGTNYESALPWDFVNNSFNNSTMSVAFTTMNGSDAIAVTWQAGALPGDRWGGRMTLPGGPYSRMRFTMDLKFSDPFSAGGSSRGGKLPGLASQAAPAGCTSVNSCSGGWTARRMWNGTKSLYSGSDVLPGHHYLYYPFKTANCGDRENFVGGVGWSLNTAHTMVQEVQVNSAHDAADGYIKTWIDDVLAKSNTGFSMYCDSESNRNAGLIKKLIFMPFWGGSNSNWSPTADSTITFGHILVEDLS